jgi:hypothetical protein
MEDNTEIELLSKRVTALETTVMKELKIIKDQNEVVKKLAEAITVIFKKITTENDEGDLST